MKLLALPTLPPQDQMILKSMALVKLLYLILAFQPKNPVNKKQDQPPKPHHML